MQSMDNDAINLPTILLKIKRLAILIINIYLLLLFSYFICFIDWVPVRSFSSKFLQDEFPLPACCSTSNTSPPTSQSTVSVVHHLQILKRNVQFLYQHRKNSGNVPCSPTLQS